MIHHAGWHLTPLRDGVHPRGQDRVSQKRASTERILITFIFIAQKTSKKCNKNVGFFGGEGAVCKGQITFLSLFLINLAYQMEDLLNSLPDRFPSAEEPAESV